MTQTLLVAEAYEGGSLIIFLALKDRKAPSPQIKLRVMRDRDSSPADVHGVALPQALRAHAGC